MIGLCHGGILQLLRNGDGTGEARGAGANSTAEHSAQTLVQAAPAAAMLPSPKSQGDHRFSDSRRRWAACFARFPQITMLHHLRERPRVWSANIRVQAGPSHAFTSAKPSLATSCASASPTGTSSEPLVRQRRALTNSIALGRATSRSWKRLGRGGCPFQLSLHRGNCHRNRERGNKNNEPR